MLMDRNHDFVLKKFEN